MPEEVSKEALKPCPFCGGAVELCQSLVSDGSPWIRHLPKSGGTSCPLEFSAFNLEGNITEAWNTRSPSALTVGEEDALTAWVTKIALEGEVAAQDGLEFGDLVRAFRAGFRAAIAAMNGGGE